MSKILENTPKQILYTSHIFNIWPIEDNCSSSFSILEKANLESQVERRLKTWKHFQTKFDNLELLVDRVTEPHLASKKLHKEKS